MASDSKSLILHLLIFSANSIIYDDYCLNQLFHYRLQNGDFLILAFILRDFFKIPLTL